MRFLVTAGSTREMIDAVRCWRSIFTGNTGLRIAKALLDVGDVDLLTSNHRHIAEIERQPPARLQAAAFTSHASLRELLARRVMSCKYDAVFMSAAVADYRPLDTFAVVSRQASGGGKEQWIVQDVQARKIRGNHGTIAILGQQTEKLVDLFRREWNYEGLLVKFKLEVGISSDELIRVGQASRAASGADYLVANTLDMIKGANAGAYLLSDQGAEWLPRAELAAAMVRLVRPIPE